MAREFNRIMSLCKIRIHGIGGVEINGGKKMNLTLVSQNKKSIWDFSQCYIFIPENSIHDIYIQPYSSNNPLMLATYEDPHKTEEIFNTIINVFKVKSKLLLTPKSTIPLQDIEAAKKYFNKLNGEDFIVVDQNFDITPIGNSYNLTYQLPEDVETI